jgi:hypothetical protein
VSENVIVHWHAYVHHVLTVACMHPSMIVDGPPGETYAVPVYCAEPHHRRKKGVPPPDASNNSVAAATDVATEAKESVSGAVPAAEDNTGDSSSSEEADTDSDAVDDDGYVICRTPRALPHNYGNPLAFIGWKFKVIPKYAHKAQYADKCSDGVIAAVVRPPGAGDDHEKLLFKCYNYITKSEEPSSHSDDWVYVPCTQFLSSSEPRRMMRWVKDTRKRERPPPEKKQNWEYTTAPPDGLFDNLEKSNMLSDEDMDTGPRTRRQRQEDHRRISRVACNSKKSVAVIPEPLPSPKEEVVDSASDNLIDESEGRKQLMPHPEISKCSNTSILQHHEQLKKAVHDRLRARLLKTRAEAPKGHYISNITYTGSANSKIPVRRNVPVSDSSGKPTVAKDDESVLLSDLSSSDASGDSDDEDYDDDSAKN